MYISEKKLLLYGLCSNAIYVFLLFLFRPDGINPQKLIISSFLAFSVLSVLFLCYRNRASLNNIPKSTRRVFIFLMLWSLFVVLRSLSLSAQDLVTNFGNVYMALAWFTPLMIILGQKVEVWKVIFKSIFFMFQLMIFALFAVPFYKGAGKLKTEWIWLLRPINFLILIGIRKFNVSQRILIYFTIVSYFIFAILTEQRIEFILLALLLIFIFIDKIKHVKVKRKLFKYIVLGFVTLTFLIFTYGYEELTLIALQFVDFHDTRIFLYNELLQELGYSKELLVGRGSLGTYYSHFMEHTKWYTETYLKQEWWGDSSTRITIEVGYLQMILKGGFILFLTNLFIMIKSSYVALFKSNNKFTKRLGVFILIISILSLISFRPAFTPTFIILWTAIGTVLNPKNRNMTDQEINNLIKI